MDQEIQDELNEHKKAIGLQAIQIDDQKKIIDIQSSKIEAHSVHLQRILRALEKNGLSLFEEEKEG